MAIPDEEGESINVGERRGVGNKSARSAYMYVVCTHARRGYESHVLALGAVVGDLHAEGEEKAGVVVVAGTGQ